jgi:hypothetical protein
MRLPRVPVSICETGVQRAGFRLRLSYGKCGEEEVLVGSNSWLVRMGAREGWRDGGSDGEPVRRQGRVQRSTDTSFETK